MSCRQVALVALLAAAAALSDLSKAEETCSQKHFVVEKLESREDTEYWQKVETDCGHCQFDANCHRHSAEQKCFTISRRTYRKTRWGLAERTTPICCEGGDFSSAGPPCSKSCNWWHSQPKCHQICHHHRCKCRPGYRVDPANTGLCLDVNECAVNNGHCSDICKNTDGSHYCACRDGRKYNSSQTCQPEKPGCAGLMSHCQHNCDEVSGECKCWQGYEKHQSIEHQCVEAAAASSSFPAYGIVLLCLLCIILLGLLLFCLISRRRNGQRTDIGAPFRKIAKTAQLTFKKNDSLATIAPTMGRAGAVRNQYSGDAPQKAPPRKGTGKIPGGSASACGTSASGYENSVSDYGKSAVKSNFGGGSVYDDVSLPPPKRVNVTNSYQSAAGPGNVRAEKKGSSGGSVHNDILITAGGSNRSVVGEDELYLDSDQLDQSLPVRYAVVNKNRPVGSQLGGIAEAGEDVYDNYDMTSDELNYTKQADSDYSHYTTLHP